MATFTVTTANDVVDAGDGLTSLREAVTLANAAPDTDTIVFDASLTGNTIFLALGELVLTQDVNIDGDMDGDNKADIVISGNNATRIFNLTGSTTDVDLNSLYLTGGNSATRGGAIYMGIGTTGSTLDIFDTTLNGNNATTNGGAISIRNGALTLTNTLVKGNTAQGFAGGISVGNAGSLTATNSTIYANSANEAGGGIFLYSSSTLTLNNSTVTQNQADADGASTTSGGGISAGSSMVNINNSVIAENLSGIGATSNDVSGAINNAQNSFFGTSVAITAGAGNISGGGDPLLATLADNGGTTQTLNIEIGSQLIDAGDNSVVPGGVEQDANGDGRIISGTVDIGATEHYLTVTSVLDTGDDATTEATLQADIADGDGLSLREAIVHSGVGGTVFFDAAFSGQTIVLGGTELALTQDITIDGDINGDDKADITISGNSASRIFVATGATTDVNLHSLTMSDGVAPGDSGGAIYASFISSVSIANTTIKNSAASWGGALAAFETNLYVTNSLVTENHSEYRGGGIYLVASSVLTLTGSTLYGNTSNDLGAGISISLTSTLNLFNSTVIANQADADGTSSNKGGGVFKAVGGAFFSYNSVIAQNTSGGGLPIAADNDVLGLISSSANSFFGTTVAITNDLGGNVNNGGDPLLGELLDNGGTTLTLSPLDGSQLIDAGSNGLIPADVQDIDGDGNTAEDLPLDGRGGLRIVGGTVDIGAVEQIVDEVIGGTDGDNNIVGGLGNDTASYEDASAGVTTYLLFTGLDTGGSGVDTLSGIENLTGSAFDDRLVGDGNDNVLRGGDGVDILKGKGGNDTFYGGAGDDRLTGDAGNDIMFGGSGVDVLYALAGFDELNGGSGNDFIYGGRDEDVLNGDQGDDEVRGNRGIDVLNGGTGNDDLRGGGQDDILNGDDGDDFLFGENHMDVLFGGAGNDSLTGGFGAGDLDGETDTFVYKDTGDGGGGFDRIKDFENGIDVMDLTSFGFANFAAVQALASDTGSGLRIDFGGGDVLFVENFLLADFNAGDVLI